MKIDFDIDNEAYLAARFWYQGSVMEHIWSQCWLVEITDKAATECFANVYVRPFEMYGRFFTLYYRETETILAGKGWEVIGNTKQLEGMEDPVIKTFERGLSPLMRLVFDEN